MSTVKGLTNSSGEISQTVVLTIIQSYMLTFGRSVEAMNSEPILVIVTMVLSVCEADNKRDDQQHIGFSPNVGFVHAHRANAIKAKYSPISARSPIPHPSPEPSSDSWTMKHVV